MVQELWSDQYLRVFAEDHEPIYRSVRTSEPFPSVHQGVLSWSSVATTFDRFGRHKHCYLSDLRAGPARNDPEFEQAMASLLPRIHAGFLRNAVLVRMAVGALQIQRHARADGVSRLITSDEIEALAYLREAFAAGPAQGSTPPNARKQRKSATR